jgi:RHS repeat-associated protein
VCGSTGYSYQRAIVIDHTQVPNTDQVNFPLLFNTTDPTLATTANGGHVTNAQGYDIYFSLDPNGATKLAHELEEYNPVTGQVIAWVRIPLVSHAADTVVYMFYGNPNVNTPQQIPTGVWDNNYLGVWHVANGTTLSLTDSTSNGNNATNNGAQPTQGEIDGGMLTNGTSFATIGAPASLKNLAQGNATFSAWVNTTAGNGGWVLGKDGMDGANGWSIGLDYNNYVWFTIGGYNFTVTSLDPAPNAWSYVTVALDQSAAQNGQATIYINGVPNGVATGTAGETGDDSTETAYLANAACAILCNTLIGSSDELRISNIARSADWIATEYNNQSSPGTFYALNGENAVEVLPAAVTLYSAQAQQFVVPGPGACVSPNSYSWSITPATLGSISTAGLYAAPANITSQQTVTVTAANTSGGASIQSGTVTLMPAVSIGVSPAAATINSTGQTQQFTATVLNTPNAAVTWTISPAGVGTIDATGLYTAPATLPTAPQTVTITATSQADSTKSATVTVTLALVVTVNLSPTNALLYSNQSISFNATGENTNNWNVNWTITPANEGYFSAWTWEYVAPTSISAEQTVVVTATSQLDPTQSASATITLEPPISIAISPASTTINTPGQTEQFTATVANTPNPGVTWTISPPSAGQISATGLYTAPASIPSPSAVEVTATSVANPAFAASAMVSLQPPQCASNGYAYQRAIVIDHTQVQNTDQQNFPFLFNTTDTSLASVDNGGHVASDNGYDIIFSLDPAGQQRLDHELEEYNPQTGQVIAWVRIPTLSHVADTILYVFYGNPNITTPQQNPAGVWDANYMGVWHMANGSVLSLADSTVNGDNATNNGAQPTAGEIDGGMLTDGTTYATIGTPSNLNNLANGNATFSAWVNTASGDGKIMGKCYGGWVLGLDNTYVDFAAANLGLLSSGPIPNGKWTYVTATLEGSLTQGYQSTIYMNGLPSASGTSATGGTSDDSSDIAYLANGCGGPGVVGPLNETSLSGSSDEFRISNVARSADWIATEYNNQSVPGTFYALQPENAAAVVPGTEILYGGQTQQFAVSGQGTCAKAQLTWSISPENAGSISASGVYTAPATITAAQTVTVTAASQTSSATIGPATITLMPPVAVTLTPASLTINAPEQTQQFTATVTNATNTAVVWSMIPLGTGTLSSSGLYTDPNVIGQVETVTITVTSVADSTKSASATITLIPPVYPNVTISPSPVTIGTPGETVQFTATTTNISQTAVTWMLVSSNPRDWGPGLSVGGLGSISSTGLYTAPPTITAPQTLQVCALVPTGGNCATVYLVPKPAITVTPASSTLYAGQSQQFKTTVTNESNTGVTWTLNPAGAGSISAAGLYIAPPNVTAVETVMITATSTADVNLSATVPLVLEASLPSSAQCWSGYSYQRSIVIDHTKVPHTDQINFPFLFSTTDPAFRTTANGGHVTSAAGYDITFSTDPEGRTMLDSEIEAYNPATGQLVAWVRIPDLSYTADTVLYVFYGNASITAPQQNAAGVWDGNFEAVYHLATPGSGVATDSTVYQNNGVLYDAAPAGGEIDGAAAFDGATSYLQPATAAFGAYPKTSIYTASSDYALTFGLWFNTAAPGTLLEQQTANSSPPGALNPQAQGSYTPALYIDTAGNLVASVFNSSASNPIVTNGVYDDGNWHYAVDTYANGMETLYVDGQSVGSMPHGENGYGTGYNYFVGAGCCGHGATWTAPANTPWLYFGGTLDEVRVSATARSADWIAAEYSDQSAPGSFYALSAENEIAVLPSAVSLTAGEAQLFAVAGVCANGAVWSISPAAAGVISPEGLYTAPNSIPTTQTVLVTATGYGTTGPIASATVTLMPPVSISVTPPGASLTAGQTQQFTATVTNTVNTGVTWTMSEGDGAISSTGVYTAPASINSQESVMVTATSQADPTQSASATITLLPVSAPSTPPGYCAANGYSYQSTITIDHTKVPNTDQTDFPFLFNTTNPSLASSANGGGVVSPNGYDIIFSLDANGQTKLDHEIEEYNPATGQLIAWIRIPTLSHTTDTIIYMFYGNPNIVGPQQNPAGTWNTNYQGVYHLASEAANNAQDSSPYGNVGALTSVSAGTGQIDGAGSFNGSSSYIQIPETDFPDYPAGVYDNLGLPNSSTTTPFQASFGVWFQTATSGGILTQTPNNAPSPIFGYPVVVEPGYYDPPGWGAWMYVDDNGHLEGAGVTSTQAYTDNKWHYAVATYATDGTNALYVDGQMVGSTTGNIPVGSSPGYNYFVGTAYTLLSYEGNWDWLYFNGNLDEVTVADVPFSADWVRTQYNNQASPATFYSFNPATSPAVSPATVSLFALQSQQFATTGICNAPVTWTLASGAPGSLTSDGFYTAPNSISEAQNVQITATNQTTSSMIGAAVVTLLPPPPPIALAAAAPSPYNIGSTQEFVATLMSQDGTPLSGVAVAFTVSGANAQLGSATTNTSGVATFSYTGSKTGTDNIQASAGFNGELLNSPAVYVLWIAPPPINPEGAVNIEMPPAIGQVGLMGAFTDGNGNVIEPVAIGATAQEFLVPAGATQLQLGVDDNHYSNNGGPGFTVAVNGATVTVPVNAMPWSFTTGGQNNNYQFGSGDGGNPVVAATGLAPGQVVTVAYQSGTVSENYPVRPLENANGDSTNNTGTQLVQGAYYPTLYTTASAYPLGQPLSFSVLVVNGSGVPEAGVPVTVTISGANPGQYQSVTDSTGTAVFLYTGSNAGTDTLLAEATTSGEVVLSSGTATVNWTAYAAPPSTGSLQLQLFGYVNNVQGYIVQATDANGNPVANANIGFYVWGADNVQTSTTTDETGHGYFSYYHVNDGTYNVEAVDSIGRNVQVSTVISGVWPSPSTSSASGSTISVTISAQSTVTLPNTLQLNGTVTDNAGVTPVLQWSQVSGLGMVTFSAPTQAVTTASFSQAGTYVVQLYATDSISNATAQFTVTVNPVPGTLQGWIGSPAYGASVTGIVPITLAPGVTIANGTLYYYPANNPNAVTVLNANVNGGGQIGQLDTTMLANGSYDIEMVATDTSGNLEYSLVLVTATGNYKPGRLTTTVTDLVVPASGLPINIQRNYDSLNANTSSDFGYGWSLEINVNLTVDPSGNVTFTLGGQRKTFYLTPLQFGTDWLYLPIYFAAFTPEPGLHGTLSDGGTACPADMLVPNGSMWNCQGGSQFTPTHYIYTDPSGTAYTISAAGNLQSIKDLSGNGLTITANGITSTTGLSVPFVRDSSNRITQITDPQGNVYLYGYDENGNLATVNYPNTPQPSTYTYDQNHYYLSGTDFRGYSLSSTNYYGPGDTDPNGLPLNGRVKSGTDALGQTRTYTYDLVQHSMTVTYPPDTSGKVGTETWVDDAYGMNVSHTDPLGNVNTNSYDANHNLIAATDALGNTTTYNYDANGNRTSRTYPATPTSKNTTSYRTYNQYAEPTSSTDELGNMTTYNYDGNYNPQSVTDSLGVVGSSLFNLNGQMLAGAIGYDLTTQPANAFQLSYDALGNLASQTDSLGRTTSYSYDSLGRMLSKTLPAPSPSSGSVAPTTTYQYDALGRLTQTTAPLKTVTSAQYDANGNRISSTDALGYATTFQYDALNRLVKTTYPDGTTSTKTYDFRNNVIDQTDQAGHVTHHVYDLAGHQISVTSGYGTSSATTTTFTYDADGRTLTTTDGLGNTTTNAYDAAGRLIAVQNAAGTTQYGFDDAGNQISVTDPNGNATQYQYDARKRLVTTTFPDSTTVVNTYNSVGNAIAVKDQAGNVTQFTFDAANQSVSTIAASSPNTSNNTTTYAYDGDGNTSSVTDENGHTTTYMYDLLSRLVSTTLPDGSLTETRQYDANGNLTSVTHFNGVTTAFTYDALNRLLGKTTPGETAVSFTYKPTGQRASMTDASGTTNYTYDSANRLTSKATPEGTLTYSYDAAGNLASIQSSNPNGASVSYAYDQAERLSSVTDNGLTGNNTTSYGYDAAGNLTSAAYPNGLQSTSAYDTLNRLVSLASPVAGYSYQLGPVGNRVGATESNGRTENWTYDGIYRLTNETVANDPSRANGSVNYGLDPVGNRLSALSSLGGVSSGTWGYNTDDEASSEMYDLNGNALLSAGEAFAYDAENHLVSMNNGAVTFAYDGDGNRVAATANGVTTRYLVDEMNPTGYAQVMDELTGGAVTRTYTYGLERISQQQWTGSTWTPSFYGYDGMGSVRQLTNSVGAVTDTYEYDAYGNSFTKSGATPNNYLYRGEQYDANLGMYYLRDRYYNPASGRFLSVDPLAGAGQRRYQYADADPVNGQDPSGDEDIVEYALLLHVYKPQLTIPIPCLNGSKWGYLSIDGFQVSGYMPPCPENPPPPEQKIVKVCSRPLLRDEINIGRHHILPFGHWHHTYIEIDKVTSSGIMTHDTWGVLGGANGDKNDQQVIHNDPGNRNSLTWGGGCTTVPCANSEADVLQHALTATDYNDSGRVCPSCTPNYHNWWWSHPPDGRNSNTYTWNMIWNWGKQPPDNGELNSLIAPGYHWNPSYTGYF